MMVDLRINETLQTGAVRKPHLPEGESVYLFLEFTINDYAMAIFSQVTSAVYNRIQSPLQGSTVDQT